ncbi:MAG TPA: hypothetical protein P5125_01170 [Kiritimatiellia bacterium]|nr:hypothetical protein [Kiritimatiellia bacterium]HOM58434.1 hypothetical protein [Kiritimatiellia bacterium]HOR97732.1 hypothetical protein [Kiritimatiellia bacterium]HPK37490.1 hypothetical protein [Kiritimatiellia bacterium]HPW75558.1 hypothetical protein [Kiritimatiellia bacterium]
MAEQDQTPQGAIPPKVTPFIKPNPEKPAVTPAATPAVTPAVTPAATPAITPAGAPRPITVRLKPVVVPGSPQAAVPAAGVPAPSPTPANLRATSRVLITEAMLPDDAATPSNKDEEAPTSATTATVRPLATAASATVRLRPVTPPSLQPQPPPTPGSDPLPSGPKPPSPAQVQASKSKTSRISLDSAIGVAPMTPMGAGKTEPKTIRLKRPVDLVPPAASGPKSSTTPIRQTSRIPDSALPSVADSAETASPTQKKTLKIKRPSVKPEGGETAAAAGEAFPDGVQLTPISPLDFPPQEESTVLTTVAVVAGFAAALVLLLLVCCLGAHAVGPDAGKNSVASLSGPELPWGGKLGK